MKDPESRSKIDNTDLVDELTLHFDEMISICDLLCYAGEHIEDQRTISHVGYLLKRNAYDAKALLESWWGDQPTDKPDSVAAVG